MTSPATAAKAVPKSAVRLGEQACTPGSGATRRATVAAAARSPVLATGTVLLPDSTPKAFRVVCGPSGVYAHQPDDAGWVVRQIAPYLEIKPVWATQATSVQVGDSTYQTTDAFPWLQPPWVCPETSPVNAGGSACASIARPQPELRKMFGYDDRLMLPWATNADATSNCGKGYPGRPDTLCFPMPDTSLCTGYSASQDAAKWTTAFWQAVGNAITLNNNKVVQATRDAAAAKVSKYADLMAGQSTTVAKTATAQATWLPFIAASLAVGILSVFVYRR